MMNWSFDLPVKITFGSGSAERIGEILAAYGLERGLLVCDSFFAGNGLADKIISYSGGRLKAVFSDVVPNPTVDNADECVKAIKRENATFALALGGGSAMDCAKAACAIARARGSIRDYHSGGKELNAREAIPLIAMPATAGTGSEVTSVAVLTDNEKGIKAPMGSPLLYPKAAVIDPLLTLSVPQRVTASTGLDVLSHALEGFWSKNHQPICDALALTAAKNVFEYLPRAYENGDDVEAREKMSEASLLAGIAFSHPKTTVCHACSFPLTNIYGLPHGEACAFTLAAAARINAECENGRVGAFARSCGFAGANEMADEINRLKSSFGMRSTLAAAGIDRAELLALSKKCLHPNILNNPVEMDAQAVYEMFEQIG